MASPLRKLHRVRHVSDMDMWAISAQATATPAEVTAVTLILALSTSDGGDELDMMEMLGECLREKAAWDEDHMGNEGSFKTSPEVARAAPPFCGSSVPGFSEPAAPGVRPEDLAAHKRASVHGAGMEQPLWCLFEGRRLRWRCVATRCSTSSALVWWFIGTGF